MSISVNDQVENFALFVGSLNANTMQEHLIEYFSKYGNVHGANLITDWATGASKRCAIVFFTDEATLSAVLAVKVHKLDGKVIRVSLADQEKKGTKKISTTNLFVGNIADKSTEQEMRLLFDKFGKIESVRFFKNASTKLNTKNAIIQYIDSKSVELAFKSKSEMGTNDDSLKISPLKQKKALQTKVEHFEDMTSMMLQMCNTGIGIPSHPVSFGLDVRDINIGQTMVGSFSELDGYPTTTRRHRKSSSVDVLASKPTDQDYFGNNYAPQSSTSRQIPSFNWVKQAPTPQRPFAPSKDPFPYKMKLRSPKNTPKKLEDPLPETPTPNHPDNNADQLDTNNFVTLIDIYNDDDDLSASFYGVSPMRRSRHVPSTSKSSRFMHGDSSSDCQEELNSRASQ